ncbi:penicillin acylase family protein [Conexibacter sp. JD483]|uniref:penicillin acylase family protein n=1 Tax=unclassified Conexibacter TaxID=2627773 RepID=UPI002725A0FC|nr:MULTISPECIES: penicillin acylase family protein [unclassified Conexibacter]MDO8184733.1 penicillin acylase family protein [Conexibacter sp. CPCC 205706]MDO8196508.1 penicillin acylase family protein [Conexibacter sp. CPCC 205762]MDR9368994.1 penicillin acylase family protein [Conexibacter sp. JD483]
MRRCPPAGRVLALSAAALLSLPAVASAKDYAGTALNVIPSGQWGGIGAPPASSDQARMYDGLTPLFDQVTDGDLTKYFKPETFGTAGQCPCTEEKVPRKGVRIVRDAQNVPHVTGRNRIDLDWAAGWILVQDRALLLAAGRYPARFAALDAPGISAFGLVTTLTAVKPSAQADKIIDREQTSALLRRGAEGRALLRDVDAYVAGMNARLRFEGSSVEPYTRVDVYSLNALAGQIFGQGGGDETRRAMLLDGLRKKLGTEKGTQVWNDLSEHVDDDTPVTISKRFPYEQVPAGRTPGSVVVDNGSMTQAGVAATANATRAHRNMSNFLILSANRSTTGHPLFVGGPQIGYFYPGLTLEMDLKAPGIEARGAAMPGGAGNILIGRGQDFAWSLTSAGSDTNDQFVETLCGGSDTKYRYKGRCRAMERINAGTILTRGPVVFYRTVHGPVLGYARAGGKRVAISFKRSSYGQDIAWQIAFKRFTDGTVTGVRSFYDAAATSPFTFNVGYADDKDIAMYSTGALPLRDKRVDPRLPTKGTGEYEWKGWLAAKDHPHVANPKSGALINWNNKPAAGFGSADDNWEQGSTQRVAMLRAGIAKREKHDLASVTSAMNAAATQDLRVQGPLLDGVHALLANTPAPSWRAQRMYDLLRAWRASGSSRLDRDLNGLMDAGAAPVIMDTFYPLLADAVLTPVLGADLNTQLIGLAGRTNATTSGFTGGRINYVDKDLRALTGTRFRSPFATRFCGGGDLAACRASVWSALDQAGAALAAARGSEDPDTWTSDATAERIRFAPGIFTTTIRYTNRPSGIQQVISFDGHRKQRK